jgi:predicted dehydrogenase
MLNNRKSIKIGIVGCGTIAFRKHLPAIARNSDVSASAFFDANEKKAQEACKEFGDNSQLCHSFENIINDPEIDAVCICVPNMLHASLAVKAMEAGKHVICEKPMAINYSQALFMAETAKKYNRVLYIAYQNRYTNEAIFLKRMKDEDRFGTIYHAKAHAVRTRAIPVWGASLDPAMQGGGPLIDIGSHVLDLSMWLTDNFEPLYLSCMTYDHIASLGSPDNYWGKWDTKNFKMEDSAFGFIVMKNGMTISLSATWSMNTVDEREGRVSLYGDLAGAEMLGELVVTHEMGGKVCNTYPIMNVKTRSLAPDHSILTANDRELAVFVKAVKEGSTGNYKQALITSGIIEGLYCSAQKREPVFFTDIYNQNSN